MQTRSQLPDLKRIVDIPLNDWRDVGNNASNIVREQIRDKRAIKGSYSAKYAINKSSRKAARSQASTQTSFVNLTLTGKMLDNLKVRKVESDGVTIGLIGTFASRAENLRQKMGYDMFNDKILDAVSRDTLKRINKKLATNIKQVTKKPVEFKIGKKA